MESYRWEGEEGLEGVENMVLKPNPGNKYSLHFKNDVQCFNQKKDVCITNHDRGKLARKDQDLFLDGVHGEGAHAQLVLVEEEEVLLL